VPGGERYGGYALKLGDSDVTKRYGALVRPNLPSDPIPTIGTRGFVAQLQQDLITLGFLEPNESTPGSFDNILKWAVREFQIMGSAPDMGGAKLSDPGYTGPLSAAKLTRHTLTGNEIYTKGDGISGVAGTATAAAIDAWISAKLRCPVVFQSYDVIPPPRTKQTPRPPPTFDLIEEGFWRASRTLRASPSGRGRVRVFACDFTGAYDAAPVPSAGRVPPAPSGARSFPVGRRNVFGKGTHQTIGPYSTIGDTFVAPSRAVVGISPTTLVNKTVLTASELSTYSVVRAVAQVECGGLFDSLNAYDGERVSAGLYHLGAFTPIKNPAGGVAKGELGAFFAYVKSQAPAVFDALLGSRGVAVVENWGDASVYNTSQSKYEAQFSLQGDGGAFAPVTAGTDADFLRNWTWFYRFEMGFRTIEQLRLLWWPYARQRLADILSTPWPDPAPGGGTTVTIGSIFRSELSAAVILRWHVLAPGNIVSGGKAGAVVRQAFATSGIPASLMLSQYQAAEEAKLIQGLYTVAESRGSQQIRHDLDTIRAGNRGQTSPTSHGQSAAPLPLGTDRTFQFFGDNIPFPRAVAT
jgi:hypothetical protein